MGEDAELLQRFVGAGSEDAFSELVRRHVGLVYFTALRRTGGDAMLAQDVAQAVFCLVARRAAALAAHITLTGWLYTTTRHLAGKAARKEQTRRRHEQAAAMHELTTADPFQAWEQMRPIIDDALDTLPGSEREAILLRFFEGRAFADMGATLRISEDAARMRVGRALDKLRTRLEGKGIRSASAALAVVLSTQAGLAVPAGMVATLSGAAMAAAAGTSGAAVLLGFMSATKLTVTAAVVATVLATGFGLAERNRATRAEARLALAAEQAAAAQARLALAQDQGSRAASRAADADEDNRRLLAAIEAAQAQQRLAATANVAPSRPASTEPGDRLSRRLAALFPNGVVATVGDKVVTVEDVRRQVAPRLAKLEAEASDPDDFGQRLNRLQNNVVKESVERILLVKEFGVPTEGEPPKSIPPAYIDNAFADRMKAEFSNDASRFQTYLESRGMTREQYLKELQEEITFRYMQSRQRKLDQPANPAAPK